MPETTDPETGATPPRGTPTEPEPPRDDEPGAGQPEVGRPVETPEAGAPEGAPPEARPSLRSMLLVLVPVGLFLGYGLVSAFISGRYPSKAVPYRERILKDPASQEAAAAALELAEMSVGQRLEIVRDGFGLPEDAWARLPAGEGPNFDSPPLEAEEWRVTVNADARPLFLVVHGTVVDWRRK